MLRAPRRSRWFVMLLAAVALSPSRAAPPAEPLSLSASEAIVLAMENNPELEVERLETAITETYVGEERGAFDDWLELEFGNERIVGRDLSSSGILFDYETESLIGEATWWHRFSTGTEVELQAKSEVEDESRDGQQLIASRMGLSVRQPLLRDGRRSANLARVRAARLDVLASTYEVRGFTELLASLVELTYWDHVAATRQLEIYSAAVVLAEELLEEIAGRVELGLLARSQLVAARAEIALRREEMVDWQSDLERTRILLLGYLDRPRGPAATLRLTDGLASPADDLQDVETHVAVGLVRRPDINQARMLMRRGALDVLRTRNGLLPRLDVFVNLGRTGYASTFSDAWRDADGDHHDVMVGLSIRHSLRNSEARADNARALLQRQQAAEAVRNLERLVEVDIRTAYVEVERARNKVAAIGATEALDEEKLAVERERFELGDASSFQVARAQRDLVKRQSDRALALAEYRKALVELYRLDGSLLARRGIVAPGEHLDFETERAR